MGCSPCPCFSSMKLTKQNFILRLSAPQTPQSTSHTLLWYAGRPHTVSGCSPANPFADAAYMSGGVVPRLRYSYQVKGLWFLNSLQGGHALASPPLSPTHTLLLSLWDGGMDVVGACQCAWDLQERYCRWMRSCTTQGP